MKRSEKEGEKEETRVCFVLHVSACVCFFLVTAKVPRVMHTQLMIDLYMFIYTTV